MKTEQRVSGEELYSLFLAGDNDSFERLVELYHNDLFHYMNSIVKDYHEAKHLTIETFAQLVASGGQFAGKSSLKTYLFTIGKNLAARYLKKRSSEQHIPFEEIVEIVSHESETPERFIMKEESRQMVRDAMKDLKDDHRNVLILLYFEDMSYLQAGHVMKKSENQIKHLAFRAKAALKKKLENKDTDYKNKT